MHYLPAKVHKKEVNVDKPEKTDDNKEIQIGNCIKIFLQCSCYLEFLMSKGIIPKSIFLIKFS